MNKKQISLLEGHLYPPNYSALVCQTCCGVSEFSPGEFAGLLADAFGDAKITGDMKALVLDKKLWAMLEQKTFPKGAGVMQVAYLAKPEAQMPNPPFGHCLAAAIALSVGMGQTRPMEVTLKQMAARAYNISKDILKLLGFHHMSTSVQRNPNSDNFIELWVRNPRK